MKNKINLLVALSIPFLMLNCSGKQSHTKIPQVQTQNSRPSLGRPISVSTPVKHVTPTQEIPRVKEIVPVAQRSKHGESYYSKKFKLPNVIKESSGLIKVDNRLWTLNDSSGKAALYQRDEGTGRIVKILNIQNASNKDWEDIAYDSTYIYIGDVGNNRGTRKDLKVYKIPRAALRTHRSVRAEVIHFSYNDQKDFTSRPQKTNYDCEAMIAHNGKLYLFSKNWQNQKTRLYELSTTPGKHKARYISTFNTQGMVTGASINKELDILILSTYSSLLNVNVWAFTNFYGNNLFKGDAKRLNLKLPLQAQVEGVTFTDNYTLYLSSEAFKKYIFSLDSMLYRVDFSGEFE